MASNDGLGAIIRMEAPIRTWASAAGHAGLAPEIPARTQMHFRVASMSKMLTATAICKLSEGDTLCLDDPIEKWLPERYLNLAAGYQKITVRLLLESGVILLGHEGADPGSWTRLYYRAEADTYIAAKVNGRPVNIVCYRSSLFSGGNSLEN